MKKNTLLSRPATIISLAILFGLSACASSEEPQPQVVSPEKGAMMQTKPADPDELSAASWSWDPQGAPEKGAALQTSPLQPTLSGPRSSHRIFNYRSDSSRSYGTENILSELSKEIAGKVYYEMKDEGQHVMSSRVAVVCAVPLSDLKRETEFGRMVAEYYLTDLADRGIQVKELRLGKDINIVPQTGEFILSQNISELANDSPALDYVVVSTFTNTKRTLILQGRMISLQSGLVKTSWRYNLPLNRELQALLTSPDQQPFTIAVKGAGNTHR